MSDGSFSHPDRINDQLQHHRNFLWVPYSLMALGLWLLTGFQPMGYIDVRMIWSDIICGVLLVVFGVLGLNPFRHWALWAAGIVGFWLCVAPLTFYAQAGAAYTTDTLVGVLVMAITIVIPNAPGMKVVQSPGPNIPPGWSYNPSSWPERIPVGTLGFLGFFTARYLAGFQLGYSDAIADPFFGDGTENVLTSEVSESFPVSDAGLGAFAYLLDVIAGMAGDTDRWRTMPWLVIIFGILVIPLGIVSTTLVILQPLSVGSWCTLCLLSALITVGMIPFTFDEVLATVQFMLKKKKEGRGMWHLFWFGGTLAEGQHEQDRQRGNEQLRSTLQSMWDDLTTKPWNLFGACIIGTWFMFSPEFFGYDGGVADSNHVVGALVITFSIIAMSEIARTGRFLNILCAIWMIASLWLYDNPGGMAMWNVIVASILLILLSFRKGQIVDERGGFVKYVK